jgi:hypothetical protein
MAFIGSAPTLSCSYGCTTSAECKTYLNSCIHGIGRFTVWSQSQCLGLGCFHGVSCFLEKCVAVCAGY